MFEKDIELARLLVSKLSELETRGRDTSGAMRQAQSELDEIKRVRDEREQYLDVLSRAAALLKREDLRVESPETVELENRLGELEVQMAEINQEASEYRSLVQDLRSRAPKLLSVATGEEDVEEEAVAVAVEHTNGEAGEQAPFEDTGSDEPVATEAASALELEDEAVETSSAEPVVTVAQADAPETTAEQPEDETPIHRNGTPETVGELELEPHDTPFTPPVVDEWDGLAPSASDLGSYAAAEPGEGSESILKRFNVANMKRKEMSDHGRGAAYIVDASSVLERVPAYDHYVRGISQEETRDELIRDFDMLSRELSGSFHLVFNSWFQPAVPFGNNVSPEFGTGEGQGSKAAGDRKLRDLVLEMTAKLRPVCIVTGDSALADSVQGEGIHIIPLGEFFKA